MNTINAAIQAAVSDCDNAMLCGKSDRERTCELKSTLENAQGVLSLIANGVDDGKVSTERQAQDGDQRFRDQASGHY